MITGQMVIESKEFRFSTQGEIDLIDLTYDIERFVNETGIKEGRITIFCIGSTGYIISTEYEPGLIRDNKEILQKLIPKGAGYNHDRIDNNAHSHLRSTLLGSEISIPIIKGKMVLGIWQQIVFVELDVHPRDRRVIFQIMGILDH